MSKYTRSSLRQDLRVRSWTKGRLANLRLLVTRLETALDESGGASLVQSEARKFDDLIPFILDLTISSGYRNFVINWSTPPGLASTHPNRQLLFYEIQHDSTPAFSDPTIIETPQRHIIVGGVGLNETRYFRGRVINTQFEASRWTSVITATSAQGVFHQEIIPNKSVRLITDVGEWQTIFTETYTPHNGAVFLYTQLILGGVQEDVNVTHDGDGGVAKTFNSGPAYVQFRYLLDGDEFSQRSMLGVRPGSTEVKLGNAPLAHGTIISEFIRPGTTDITFTLQAAKCPGSEWSGGKYPYTRPPEISDPLVFTRNGKIIEALENL